jgi:hypothetical protein
MAMSRGSCTMKKWLICLGIVAFVVIALVAFCLYKAAGFILEAQGRALYSAAGAWTRIHEFAVAQGKPKYIAAAESTLGQLESDLKQWREAAEAMGFDISSFEKTNSTAYETTDKNIKNGHNPLAYLDST